MFGVFIFPKNRNLAFLIKALKETLGRNAYERC